MFYEVLRTYLVPAVQQISAEGPPHGPPNTAFCHISAHGWAKHAFRVASNEILRAPLYNICIKPLTRHLELTFWNAVVM